MINGYLVDIFNKVNVIEEQTLRASQFRDATLKEMHTIDIIGKGDVVTPTDISKELMLTLGTVTTSLNKLEDKGYIIRERSNEDRRVVYVKLTDKGQALYESHHDFHRQMIAKIVEGMNGNQRQALGEGLVNLHSFLENLI